MKFKFKKELDYVVGHLRYGHIEGIVEAALKRYLEYEE